MGSNQERYNLPSGFNALFEYLSIDMPWKVNCIVAIFSIACTLWVHGQNLVPNGGFEKHMPFDVHSNPFYSTQRVVLDWKDFNGWTAAYCHTDLVKKYGYEQYKREGWWKFDTNKVFEGDAMIKFWYGESCPERDTGCTGYLKTKLIPPMELGEIYEVSMWVYITPNIAADTATYSRIGMYLTRHAVPYYTIEDMLPVDFFFNGKPVPGEWTQIKWYIRPLCRLEHLTIGMFRDSTFKSLFRQTDIRHEFFIDGVTIEKINQDSIPDNVVATPYCEYFERQHKDQLLISVTAADVLFPSNEFELDARDKAVIDSFYEANAERKQKIFIVIGHTDDQQAENKLLSERRANSVKQYLVESQRLPAQTVLAFGMASAKPKTTNATSSGRTINRRATIRTSDLIISQLIYRQGLEALQQDSTAKASVLFSRWIRLTPKSKQVEMLTDPRLQKLKRSAYWKNMVIEVRKAYVSYKDSKNAFFLDSLYFEDQRYRTPNYYKLSGFIEEIDTLVAPELKFNEKLALQKDSINFAALNRYFEKNGFPSIDNVGRRAARAFGYIILHNGDRYVYEKFIPLTEQMCIAGEAQWDIYMMMCDKLSVEKDEPQRYGTQYVRNEYGQSVLYKVDNMEGVNARRIYYGLTPISIE